MDEQEERTRPRRSKCLKEGRKKYTWREREIKCGHEREMKNKTGILAPKDFPIYNSRLSSGSPVLLALRRHLFKLVFISFCPLQSNGPEFNRDTLLFSVQDKLKSS